MSVVNPGTNLKEVLRRLFEHQAKLDEKACQRAARLVIQDRGDLSDEQKSLLEAIASGERGVTDSPEDVEVGNLIGGMRGRAEHDLRKQDANRLGKPYYRAPIWDFALERLEKVLCPLMELHGRYIGGDRFFPWAVGEYCKAIINLDGLDDDPFAQEVEGLDQDGFTDKFCRTLCHEYPDEMKKLGLASPNSNDTPPDSEAESGPQTSTDQPARHSPDFRSVRWFGTDYTFTATQAAIVKVLWEAWERDTSNVGSETLLEAADSKTSRLVDAFRNHPAWGTLIVDGSTKGSKRLATPAES